MGQAKQRGTFEERRHLALAAKSFAQQEEDRVRQQIERRDAERKKIGGTLQRRLENEVVLAKGARKLGSSLPRNVATMLVAAGFTTMAVGGAVAVDFETVETKK